MSQSHALPLVSPVQSPEPVYDVIEMGLENLDDLLEPISSVRNGSNPWEKCIKLCKNFDEKTCEALKGELDNLMLFATLFSAIVTAFTIDSYKWLQSSSDPPVTISVAIQVNVLWFLSLASSLGVASVGILCTQWVRQYGLQELKPTRRSLALHRQRYQGFRKWQVQEIISLLPVLLQLALVLFGIGIIRFLWALHHTVATAFMVVSIITIAFVLVTMFAPILQWWLLQVPHVPYLRRTWQCPFQSPQAWIFYTMSWWTARPFRRDPSLFESDPGNWRTFDESWLDLAEPKPRPRLEAKNANSVDRSKLPIHDADLKDIAYVDRLISNELIWLDKTFSDDLEGIKARAEALRYLPFKAAKYVVGERLTTYAQRQPLSKLEEVLESLKPFNDIRQTPNTASAREKATPPSNQTSADRHDRTFKHLRAWYLWAHAQDHPGLDDAYMESRIQFMSEIPRDEIILPAPPRTHPLDVYCLVKPKENGKDDRIVSRFLHCLKMLVKRNKLTSNNSAEIWRIIGDLLEYSIRHDYTAYFPELGLLCTAVHDMVKHQLAEGMAAHSPVQFVNKRASESPGKAAPSPTIHEIIQHMLDGLEPIYELEEAVHPLMEQDLRHINALFYFVKNLRGHVDTAKQSDWEKLEAVLNAWTKPVAHQTRDNTVHSASQFHGTISPSSYATASGQDATNTLGNRRSSGYSNTSSRSLGVYRTVTSR